MNMREGQQSKRAVRIIVAIISALVIAFCAWSMSQYVRGNDPLALFTGKTTVTVQTDVTPGATDGAQPTGQPVTPSPDATPSPNATPSPGTTPGVQDDSSDGSGTSSANGSSGGSGSASGSSGSSSSSGGSGSQRESDILVTVTVDGTAVGSNSSSAQVSLSSGSTAFDALRATGVSVNARNSQYGIYVTGINGLAEKDHGGSSGWVYEVNGSEPNTSAGNYTLKDGDSVVWRYVNVEN